MNERTPAHPQVVEGMGARLPIPPPTAAAFAIMLEIGVSQRPAGGNRGLDFPHQGTVLLQPLAPAAIAQRIVEHGAPPPDEVGGGHEARRVCPIFEEDPSAIDEAVEGAP